MCQKSFYDKNWLFLSVKELFMIKSCIFLSCNDFFIVKDNRILKFF